MPLPKKQQKRASAGRLIPVEPDAKGGTPRLADAQVPEGTFCDIGVAVEVGGKLDAPWMLVLDVDSERLAGLDRASIRMFRYDPASHSYVRVERSGYNATLGFAWARLTAPGVYLPVGAPRDAVLRSLLLAARRHRQGTVAAPSDPDAAVAAIGQIFGQSKASELDELRRALTALQVHTGRAELADDEVRLGRGGHLLPFHLPGGLDGPGLAKRAANMRVPAAGLPEEELLDDRPPTDGTWSTRPADLSAYVSRLDLTGFRIWDTLEDLRLRWPLPFPWLFSTDWPMYHHDRSHSGVASGWSSIDSSTVQRLFLAPTVDLGDGGKVVSVPSIVAGKAYIGTVSATGGGGRMHRVDLASATLDDPVAGGFAVTPGLGYFDGIGGSPAVIGGRVYFTAIPAQVYCIDANTFALIWKTDLRNRDLAHAQPCQNTTADCWASPVVANGRVYVGCGEGEGGAFGFVYCLEAATGNVQWLFCTTVFPGMADNAPNLVPNSAVSGLSDTQLAALGPGFSRRTDPARGASVWSSLAYHAGLNRVFVGTGNTEATPPAGAIDAKYGSGVLALDATTGAFEGFFQPAIADSYYPGDSDIDVPSSPTLFTRAGSPVLAIGSKSGAFVELDAATMAPVTTPRQLLPRRGGAGFRGDGSQPIPNVDPGGQTGGENEYGVFGTAAVHYGLRLLYVGLGGYGGAIDSASTPFMRAVRWTDLSDGWPTTIGSDGVARYTGSTPPMYTTPAEAGLTSPAVVNDVVFVTTSAQRLYALDAATGVCLWVAPGITAAPAFDTAMFGPAISGDTVVVAVEDTVYIYKLGWIRPPWPPIYYRPPLWEILNWPPPPPPPPDGFDPGEVGGLVG